MAVFVDTIKKVLSMAKAKPRVQSNWLAALLLLIIPLTVYTLLYLAPLGSIVSLSVDNGELSSRFPHLSEAISSGNRDEKAKAFLIDIAAMDTRGQGETARLLNQEFAGFRSLFLNTVRNVDKIEPSWQGLTAFDGKWNDDKYWRIVENNASRFTGRYFQKATGLSLTSGGNISTDDDVYVQIMLRTLLISMQVTLLTLVIGYPLAYAVANGGPRLGNFVLTVILLSFWTSILVRTTAWVVLLQTNGIVNNFLIWLGIISQPLQLIFNRFGTLVAMTHVLLPFAIIPMMNVMRTIPRSQSDASRSLGAGGIETFLRVYFPQSTRGVAVGGGTVFILALGFYVTPALTGGPGDQMLSFYIADFIKRSLNWGMASALSVMLLGGLLVLLSFYGAVRWLATNKRSAA
ncbi:ABC transporter permease (plasmid) [Brucella sp. 6810]|uniref:ABC transporter permease n=1 Tax=Brucella sp. 6810 TaxID=2769351 RepID=UPI00165B6DDE|nr:ABC transporter permease [Brucella sp. 6810]QNQ64456.1 ABC transporter permease [Brucella sp. 6810]